MFLFSFFYSSMICRGDRGCVFVLFFNSSMICRGDRGQSPPGVSRTTGFYLKPSQFSIILVI